MDLIIQLTKLATAVASLVATVIKAVSAAQGVCTREKDDRKS